MKLEELKVGDIVTQKGWVDEFRVEKIEFSDPPTIYLASTKNRAYGRGYSKGKWVRAGWILKEPKSEWRRIVL
jgi:hypothetical protein